MSLKYRLGAANYQIPIPSMSTKIDLRHFLPFNSKLNWHNSVFVKSMAFRKIHGHSFYFLDIGQCCVLCTQMGHSEDIRSRLNTSSKCKSNSTIESKFYIPMTLLTQSRRYFQNIGNRRQFQNFEIEESHRTFDIKEIFRTSELEDCVCEFQNIGNKCLYKKNLNYNYFHSPIFHNT
jgi:hypothetical protein